MKSEITISANKIKRRKKAIKIIRLAIFVSLLFLFVLYFAIGLVYNSGNFSITLDRNLYLEKNIIIYDDVNYKVFRSELFADAVESFDNISYKWLPDDPKKLTNGKLKLPGNLWFIGTINNDDSTFMVTDKVYDRAMPIDINDKCAPFKCKEQEAIEINSSYLEQLFIEAAQNKPISDSILEKIKEMDDYVIKHFRIAFGNRIMKQLSTFVPVYTASGGKEIEAVDYFIAKKIFRKFEQLNISFIRDEIDPFISYLNKNFGDGNMKECISFLERIKKSI